MLNTCVCHVVRLENYLNRLNTGYMLIAISSITPVYVITFFHWPIHIFLIKSEKNWQNYIAFRYGIMSKILMLDGLGNM